MTKRKRGKGVKIKRNKKPHAKLGWTEGNKNYSTLKKVGKANFDEYDAGGKDIWEI